jgi:zinc transporter 2
MQSGGVMIAALIIYFEPEYKIIDPILTLVFCVLVCITTIPILIEVIRILMEEAPHKFDMVKIYNGLHEVGFYFL